MKPGWGRAAATIVTLALSIYLGCAGGYFSEAYRRAQTIESFPVVINEVMVSNRGCVPDGDGYYDGYVELYNVSADTVDLTGFGISKEPHKPYLWRFPKTVLPPYSFLVVFLSGKDCRDGRGNLHANFKIGMKDRILALTSPCGGWRACFILQNMYDNISCGRVPDGGEVVEWFDGGTAGSANTLPPLILGASGDRLGAVGFSTPSGFYDGQFTLLLTHEDPEAVIRYTLDGSMPTETSPLCVGGIAIPEKSGGATVVRARAYIAGVPPSPVATATYFVQRRFAQGYGIPVVSIVTDPVNLFDFNKGIYVPGKVQSDWQRAHPGEKIDGKTPGNYNQKGKKWERHAHLEVFAPGGSLELAQEIGIRTNGRYSLAAPNKSLRFVANADYGPDAFQADLFPGDSDPDALTSVILRTSATDEAYSLLRDAYIQSLADPSRLDLQKSRLCVAFINGAYYGIYSLRPRYNAEYLAGKYGIAQEYITILHNPTGGVGDRVQEGFQGDELAFCRLYDFICNNNMENMDNYRFVEKQMDVSNYIEFNILEIYCGNTDWPANNVRIWRKRTARYEPDAPYGSDGRWRWLVYDLDTGFGLFGHSYAQDSLMMAMASGSSNWSTPPWSTAMLRSLLENEEFRNKFINRFEDLLNTRYGPNAANSKLEAMERAYAPYVPDHLERWGLLGGKMENWLDQINNLRVYAQSRPDYLRQFLRANFHLGPEVALSVNTQGSGSVCVNSLTIRPGLQTWCGTYFQDIPVMLEARPDPGYRFLCWKGSIDSIQSVLNLRLSSSTSLEAIFEKNP